MRERNILLSGPMVVATLRDENPKTQTRRVVKCKGYDLSTFNFTHLYDQPDGILQASFETLSPRDDGVRWVSFACPYGKPGDRLIVRENIRAIELAGGQDVIEYAADCARRPIDNTPEGAERWMDVHHYGVAKGRRSRGSTVPAIHMPRWAARLALDIVDIRIERLNDCSPEDAGAEGLFRWIADDVDGDPRADGRLCHQTFWNWREPKDQEDGFINPVTAYGDLWNHINGPGAWGDNPWVWVITFRKVLL